MQCKQHNEAQGRKENVPVLDVEIRRHRRALRRAGAPTIARALAVWERLRLGVEVLLPHGIVAVWPGCLRLLLLLLLLLAIGV